MPLTPSRVRKTFEAMVKPEERPDVILVRNATEPHLDLSFFYYTGVPAGLFEGCSLLLHPDGKAELFTSPLEEESALRARPNGYAVVAFKGNGEHDKEVVAAAGRPRRIGMNFRETTHSSVLAVKKLFPDAELVDVSKAVAKARMVKDADEISAIREACRAVSKAAARIPEMLKEGVTEEEAAARLDYEVMLAGAQGKSFDTIAAFGANAAEPHYAPQRVALRANQFALFDYGGKWRRYCSDITRTFFYGRADAKAAKMYATVAEAQAAGFELLRAGEKAGDVHKAAEAVIDATEWKGRFIHSLGHGLGLAVHDGGTLHPSVDLTLEENMVMTVEPGIYVPGYGGVRIEDDCVVRKGQPEILTTAPRDLIEVG